MILRPSASEFSTQIVDGLGRPVPGARVEVRCDSPRQTIPSLRFESDAKGMIHGTYDAALCSPGLVDIEKEGFGTFSAWLRSRYVLRREFSGQEVHRVAKLSGDVQERELRELLAGDWHRERNQFDSFVFFYEATLRSALRALARDSYVTEQARELLALIGVPEDLHLILQLPPPPAFDGVPGRWRYWVGTSLINADGDDEWSFLRQCAFNEFGDNWVDAGAIQTLKLIGSPRSEGVLLEARKRNRRQAARIADALRYIRSKPAPLVDGSRGFGQTHRTRVEDCGLAREQRAAGQ